MLISEKRSDVWALLREKFPMTAIGSEKPVSRLEKAYRLDNVNPDNQDLSTRNPVMD